jgi:hypothetical protein
VGLLASASYRSCARRVLHGRDEAVDLLGDLLVGELGSVDGVADACLAPPALAQEAGDRRREDARVEPSRLEFLAALGALALEDLARLVPVEVGARDGDPVDHDADGQQRQQQVEQQPGDHDPREQADVERLGERVDDERAVVLGPAVGTHLAGHQKKLEMLR